MFAKLAGGSVAEWLACWTQAQKAWVQIAARGKLFTPIVTVHQAAKSVAIHKGCVARVTAGLALAATVAQSAVTTMLSCTSGSVGDTS